MDLGLKDRVALVAAASKGLGKATALELAREGCDVAIVSRNADVLDATAAEIREATGRRVLVVPADVGDEAAVERLVQVVLAEYGRIDVLVNNAGGPPPGTFTDVSDEDWLHAVQLNLMSAVRLTRLVLPGMRERRWGRIINITSVSVKQPMPTLILSNAVRVGVVAMAKTLAGQVAGEGITVNNVCPGSILTDRITQLTQADAQREGISFDEALARRAAAIPMGRIGLPEELAALIAFLASERAAYITGTTIQVDGGAFNGLM
ncbi:MAG: SDR family oxidoreductase [Anaerolineae bacterium]|jgi:3-oxoacyl-[acyl-carrier protein] reductase